MELQVFRNYMDRGISQYSVSILFLNRKIIVWLVTLRSFNGRALWPLIGSKLSLTLTMTSFTASGLLRAFPYFLVSRADVDRPIWNGILKRTFGIQLSHKIGFVPYET
jgi:hypothetical protein